MKIVLRADHAGFELKEKIKQKLISAEDAEKFELKFRKLRDLRASVVTWHFKAATTGNEGRNHE